MMYLSLKSGDYFAVIPNCYVQSLESQDFISMDFRFIDQVYKKISDIEYVQVFLDDSKETKVCKVGSKGSEVYSEYTSVIEINL